MSEVNNINSCVFGILQRLKARCRENEKVVLIDNVPHIMPKSWADYLWERILKIKEER